MGVLGTSTSSSSRPGVGGAGSVFFEPSSNNVIVKKADGSFKELATKKSLKSSSPAGALNYPGGLFSDMSGTYTLSEGPHIHYDAQNSAGTLRDASYSVGDAVTTWGDCSGSGQHAVCESTADAPVLTDQGGGILSVNNSSNASGQYILPEGLHYMKTVFFIQGGASNVTPFGKYNAFRQLSTTVNRYFDIETSSNKGVDTSSAGQPNLRCAVFNLTEATGTSPNQQPLHVWDVNGGASYSTIGAYPAVTYDYSSFLHTYAGGNYEIILFNKVLDISDINTVFSYLKNKYDGVGSIDSSAATLTLS